jgi:DNA-binding FadR family transcriptional regulator
MRVHQDVTDRIRLIRRLDFTKEDRITATCDEHAAILKAVISRRKSVARCVCSRHTFSKASWWSERSPWTRCFRSGQNLRAVFLQTLCLAPHRANPWNLTV